MDTNYKRKELNMGKAKLNHVEFQVCSQCNLKNKGCGAFSNYAEEKFADLRQYEKDMMRLAEIFQEGIGKIYLMGGELFLNPQIGEFFKNKIIKGIENGKKAFEKCFKCYTLRNGLLAQCGLPIHAKTNFKKYFKFEFMNFEVDRDYIDLYTTRLSGEEINQLFASSKEFCRIHNSEFFDWELTDKAVPDIYDWSV